MSKTILFWRRTDVQGLEHLELDVAPDRIAALSTGICLDDGGFRIDHRWRLSPDWRAQSVVAERSSQRYDRQGPGRVRYVDLGLSAGFEADLVVDGQGLVLSYAHLFERVGQAA